MSQFAIGDIKWPGAGKLIEEMGELTAVLGKLMGSRGSLSHWVGDLREKLHEELGDVLAALDFFVSTNQVAIDSSRVEARAVEKMALFEQWHKTPVPIVPAPVGRRDVQAAIKAWRENLPVRRQEDIRIIVAADDKNGIARGGAIPWRIPEDLRRFREMTKGGTVIMGRRTWESLPDAYRPLPGRTNVILSRKAGTTNLSVPGAPVWQILSFSDIAHLYDELPRPHWVIGGGEVYKQVLEMGAATIIYLTRVFGDFECDTFWPGVPEDWTKESSGPIVGANFEVWKKNTPAP